MDRLFIVSGDKHNIPFEDFVNHFFQKGGLMVDMGCGDKKIHPTFIGIDPYIEDMVDTVVQGPWDDIVLNVNIKAYMWDTPFEDNSVDFLTCFAALEHISKYHVIPALREFARILKPEAAFAISVPNLYYIFDAFIKNPNTGWEMDMLFGDQTTEGEYHRTGFTVDIIKWYFEKVPELKILNIYDINAYCQWNYGIIGKKLLST